MSYRKKQMGIPWGPALLSGVDFRCKIQQPKVDQLPENLTKEFNYEFLMNSYSFEVEKTFLNKLAKQEKEEKRLKEEKSAKEQSKTAAMAKSCAANQLTIDAKSPYLYTPKFERDSQNQIKSLTPFRNESHKDAGGDVKVTTESKANKKTDHDSLLRDFDQADNPFDIAELNTLNDMEELRDLLAYSVVTSVGHQTVAHDDKMAGGATVDDKLLSLNHSTINTSQNSVTEISQQQMEPSVSIQLKNIQFPRLNSEYSDTGNIETDSILSSPPSISPNPPHRQYFSGNSNPDITRVVFSRRGMNSSHSSSSILPNSDCYPPHPSPPPLPSASPHPHHQIHSSKSQSNVTLNYGQSAVSRNSSNSSLKESAKSCSSDHVAKVRIFESRGVSTEEAEQAMIFYPADLDKALQFATMKHELQEFGFSSAKVQEILISVDLDRDKAINILQSLPLTP